MDAVKETITDVLSASPSSERLLPSSTLIWYTSLSLVQKYWKVQKFLMTPSSGHWNNCHPLKRNFFPFSQLFGKNDPTTHLWADGVISKHLRDSTLIRDTTTEALSTQAADRQRLSRGVVLSRVDRWLVLDGPMSGAWMDSMGSVLDTSRKLCLANGDAVAQPGEANSLSPRAGRSGSSRTFFLCLR